MMQVLHKARSLHGVILYGSTTFTVTATDQGLGKRFETNRSSLLTVRIVYVADAFDRRPLLGLWAVTFWNRADDSIGIT
jgi:hypothetical protein